MIHNSNKNISQGFLKKELARRGFATPDLRMKCVVVRIKPLKETFIFLEILDSEGCGLQLWSLFWRPVIGWKSTDVSKKSAVSIFRTENYSKLIIDGTFFYTRLCLSVAILSQKIIK